jgi:hypothetical protein
MPHARPDRRLYRRQMLPEPPIRPIDGIRADQQQPIDPTKRLDERRWIIQIHFPYHRPTLRKLRKPRRIPSPRHDLPCPRFEQQFHHPPPQMPACARHQQRTLLIPRAIPHLISSHTRLPISCPLPGPVITPPGGPFVLTSSMPMVSNM